MALNSAPMINLGPCGNGYCGREIKCQVLVTAFTGSVALLADTIHNSGDAATSIPLWIAFARARRKPSQRSTYGYGRVEDLAGVTIVFIILFSAVVAGVESVDRLLHPRIVAHLWAAITASVIGFVGNEAVVQYYCHSQYGRRP